jgi:hypothetical protein
MTVTKNKLVCLGNTVWGMHTMDGRGYLSRGVSYMYKMSINWTTGVNLIKLFVFITDKEYE